MALQAAVRKDDRHTDDVELTAEQAVTAKQSEPTGRFRVGNTAMWNPSLTTVHAQNQGYITTPTTAGSFPYSSAIGSNSSHRYRDHTV